MRMSNFNLAYTLLVATECFNISLNPELCFQTRCEYDPCKLDSFIHETDGLKTEFRVQA